LSGTVRILSVRSMPAADRFFWISSSMTSPTPWHGRLRPPADWGWRCSTSTHSAECGFNRGTRETALHLARLAQDSGVSGVVASAEDAAAIRKACGGEFLIVTPGIRAAGKVAGDDQKRIVTPAEAVSSGADYLVVGRPISQAEDPAGAADAIAEEIARGLALRDGG
jgi:orotidine-5'-phosphate decarboxylase